MIGLLIVVLFLSLTFYYYKIPHILIQIQVIFSIVAGFAIYNLGAPRASLYLCDFINILLIIHIFYRNKYYNTHRNIIEYRFAYKMAIIFLAIGTISALINFSGIKSLLLFCWSLRNYYRFFIFFVACTYFIRAKDISKMFYWMKILLYISTVLSFYQYYVMGYGVKNGDLIGGIFGTNTGSNGSLNLFFLGMCTYYLWGYLYKKVSLKEVCLILICCFVSASLGEIKFFYIELIIITALLVIFNKPGIKTVTITVTLALFAVVGTTFLQNYYSTSLNFFDLNSIIKYASQGSYSYSLDSINRLDGIQIINRLFFNNKPSLLGIGLGNADRSSFFSSAVYDTYAYTHYHWFLTAYLYLETGLLGLISYISIYVALFVDCIKMKGKKIDDLTCKSCMTLSLMALAVIVYNASLRVDAAYIFFAFLAIPFISSGVPNDEIFNHKSRIRFKWGTRGG